MYEEGLHTFINKQHKKNKMKNVMIALAFVAVSSFAACSGSAPEGETKTTDSTSVCAVSSDSVVVLAETTTVTPADTTK